MLTFLDQCRRPFYSTARKSNKQKQIVSNLPSTIFAGLQCQTPIILFYSHSSKPCCFKKEKKKSLLFSVTLSLSTVVLPLQASTWVDRKVFFIFFKRQFFLADVKGRHAAVQIKDLHNYQTLINLECVLLLLFFLRFRLSDKEQLYDPTLLVTCAPFTV